MKIGSLYILMVTAQCVAFCVTLPSRSYGELLRSVEEAPNYWLVMGEEHSGNAAGFSFRNVSFYSPFTFVVPFVPRSSGEVCDKNFAEIANITNIRSNANVDFCPQKFGGKTYQLSVAEGGPMAGQVLATFTEGGDLVLAYDLVLSAKNGKRYSMPIYATTGWLMTSPHWSPRDVAPLAIRDGKIRGTIGDADGDGFLDGTLVSVGHFDLPGNKTDKPNTAQQPSYVLVRSFELSVPYAGDIVGRLPNAQNLHRDKNPDIIRVIPPRSNSVSVGLPVAETVQQEKSNDEK